MHNHPPAGERRRVIMMKTGYSIRDIHFIYMDIHLIKYKFTM